MRQRVTAAFVAIVGAFLVLNTLVLVSLWPKVHETEALSRERAEGSRVLARAHGELHAMSNAALQVVQLRSGGIGEAEAEALGTVRGEFDAAANRFAMLARDYAATPMDPAHELLWRRLSAEVYPTFLETAERIVRTASAKAVEPEAVIALGRETHEADDVLQELAQANASLLIQETTLLHASVHNLALIFVALGLVGIAASIFLVIWTLRAVRNYERSTQERLVELDTFAGRVAHDLRNPLNTVSLSLAVIGQRIVDERALETCAKAQNSVKRASQFIQELLAFARSGAVPSPNARANVEQALRDTASDLAAEAERRNVQLVVRPVADLHAAISPEALRAIVANLADNAVKYMPPDRRDPAVELTGSRNGRGEVEITVRDNGAGIAEEELPHVFDGFYRATDAAPGFGIGLATVKRLVQAHRGRLHVTSEAGRGSRFTVVLPAAPSPAAAEPHAAAASAGVPDGEPS